jgi:O-antigen ligase
MTPAPTTTWIRPAGGRLLLAASLGVLALGAACVVRLLPASLVSWETIPALIVGALTAAALLLISGLSDARSGTRRLAFFLWWVLLSSEEFFIRWNESASTSAGDFAPEAYAEAGVWVLIFVAVLIVGGRGAIWIRQAFLAPYRYLTLLAIVCGASVAISPHPAFSLAWAFKLGVAVLLLETCAGQILDPAGLAAFLKCTLWGVAFLAIEPVIRALVGPEPLFVDGRPGNVISPTGLSAIAASLFLLALALRRVTPSRWLPVLGVLGASIMIMAGGKTAILAGIVSGMLFFALQKKLGPAVGVPLVMVVLGAAIIPATPLSSYFENYLSTENTSTLTGRTRLWELAAPEILQHPILGHGYAVSRFAGVDIEGVGWDAGHLHNGFLETLYNNGAAGLAVMLLIHGAIIRRVFKVLRRRDLDTDVLQLAAGCAAIYLNIFINSIFNASFGGRAGGMFLLLLALVVITERLAALAQYPVELHARSAAS